MSKRHHDRKLARVRSREAAKLVQGAGRPKLDRPRYTNGRLKPVGPNERVVALRRRLLGNPEASGQALRWAENPLDLLWKRGLISQAQHEAAGSLRRLYLAAFPAMPDMKTGRLDEAPGEESSRMDRSAGAVGAPNLDGNPHAMTALREVWGALKCKPAAWREILDVCLVVGRWPSWVEASALGRPSTSDEHARRLAFLDGLGLVERMLSGFQAKAA